VLFSFYFYFIFLFFFLFFVSFLSLSFIYFGSYLLLAGVRSGGLFFPRVASRRIAFLGRLWTRGQGEAGRVGYLASQVSTTGRAPRG